MDVEVARANRSTDLPPFSENNKCSTRPDLKVETCSSGEKRREEAKMKSAFEMRQQLLSKEKQNQKKKRDSSSKSDQETIKDDVILIQRALKSTPKSVPVPAVNKSLTKKKRKEKRSTTGLNGSRSEAEENRYPELDLNGDDVPLVEDAMDALDDSNTNLTGSGIINGDNFEKLVRSSNEGMMRKMQKQKEDYDLSFQRAFGNSKAVKDKKKSGKKRKSEAAVEEIPTVEEKPKKKLKTSKSKDLGSVEKGKKYFEWMIGTDSDDFFKKFWEKGHYLKKRNDKNYYKSIFSTKEFDSILHDQDVLFTKNLDVTSYEDGKRETHNQEGKAYPSVVWDYYNTGCSLRMINPQTFSPTVWEACATLQDLFGSMVGANVYLTPPGTQGFAPHYDDVEVFILQLEGKKHWRLYDHRNDSERLARHSSQNFNQDEIGQPRLDVTLEAGDLLYFPRGTIHQANCLDDVHSMHITISCHQLHTLGDLLQTILPAALETALAESVDFRKGLPINYLDFMGAAHSEKSSLARIGFIKSVESLAKKVFSFASLDAACDQFSKRFLHDSLPPFLTLDEEKRSVARGGERWHVGKGRVVNRVELDPDTRVRLIRARSLRLVCEQDQVGIYYNVENSREYHAKDEQFMQIEAEMAPAVEELIHQYPNYINIEQLPYDEGTLDDKMKLVQALWEKKLLLTEQPLEAHYDD